MQFFRFILAGALNTGITYALYLALLAFFDYLISYSTAYAAGVVISYWLNSAFVFRSPISWRRFFRFPAVYVVQYLLTGATLWVAVRFLDIPEKLALLVAIAISIPATFFAARLALLSPR